ncbi:RNA pyrophosphohydrolase [Candidatus Paracaedibacter symbiosus]|uniref:RNA pyrophosphohydrolase n=1 Tax=Candidatus Paracaedibacter symbiosus TaxID=244582 RepID=UPI000509CA03|nr:RNA pyrophosphohydrolase [Candidatus Paracaedibacter symbiosus]
MNNPKLRDSALYRPCIGLMIINSSRQIFMARRNDLCEGEPYAWQMPQGGIDADETPHQAAMRELEEEIGTDKVALMHEANDWFYYDFPKGLKENGWANRFAGQRQRWFLFEFTGEDKDINLDTQHPEFSQWRWGSKEDIISQVVPFKLHVYEQVFAAFAKFLG